MLLLQGAVGSPDVVKREYPGDRHLEVTGRGQSGQLGQHGGAGRVCVARRLDAELLHGGEVDDGVDPLGRDPKAGDRQVDVAAAEQVFKRSVPSRH